MEPFVPKARKARKMGVISEALEPRLFLTVTQDANGWTVVSPTTTGDHPTQIIYVSSTGNDSADGLSTSTPVKSLSVAMGKVRNGFPDWVLLKARRCIQRFIRQLEQERHQQRSADSH